MTPATWAVLPLILLSLSLLIVIRMSQVFVLRAKPPPPPGNFPKIRILKPLKGVDPDLEENLRSVFSIDYPDYDIVLGTADMDDPALAVARKVALEHPEIPAMCLADASMVGLNPKVNNLANLAKPEGPSLIVISDSNIRVPANYLKELAACRERAGGGLVWSLFRGVGGKGLGGLLEELQLNTFVMGGMCAVTALTKKPCALGKSMFMDRSDLEKIGGFKALSRFLAEDQICAEEMASQGIPVSVSNNLVDNVLGRKSFKEFTVRHLRWARLRRNMNLTAYIVEPLLNPVFIGAAAAAVFHTMPVLAAAGSALMAVCVLDALVERMAGVRRRLYLYPPLEIILAAVTGILWFVPLFSRKIVWRGNPMKIGPRSVIQGG